jgi:hypothetical protein
VKSIEKLLAPRAVPHMRLNVLEDERVHVACAQATQQIEDRETRRVCQPGPPD